MDAIYDVVIGDLVRDRDRRPRFSAGWHTYGRAEVLNYMNLLASVARQACMISAGQVVEVGTDYGLGAFSMATAVADRGRTVHTFDVKRPIIGATQMRCEALGITNVRFILGKVEPGRLVENGLTNLAMAYVDGAHSYDECHHDLEALMPSMDRRGVILCHDFCEERPGLGPDVNGVRQAVAEAGARDGWQALSFGGFGVIGRRLT